MAKIALELGRGEASCIACAALRKLRIFTDDRDARRIALGLHVPVSGTLGVLLLLVDAGILSKRSRSLFVTNDRFWVPISVEKPDRASINFDRFRGGKAVENLGDTFLSKKMAVAESDSHLF